MARRIVILTEGHTNPHTAKTASCMIRYKTDEIVALLDSAQRGKTTQELLGVGGDLPVVIELCLPLHAQVVKIDRVEDHLGARNEAADRLHRDAGDRLTANDGHVE